VRSWRSTGPPQSCWATGKGFATRRTGPVLAILGAERSNGALPDGYRRPASLEDVFVVLTGQEIE